jgi:hypothetical protein
VTLNCWNRRKRTDNDDSELKSKDRKMCSYRLSYLGTAQSLQQGSLLN